MNYKSISIFVANLQMSKEYPNSKIVNINNSDSKASAEASGKFNFTVSIID